MNSPVSKHQIVPDTLGDVIAAYNKTTFLEAAPEYGFGTSSRPPLSEPTAGPGPGAYPIKSTLKKIAESKFVSPPAITLKGRTKFGDPNAHASSKACAAEPGPGQYSLQDVFLTGKDPRNIVFPKASQPRDKAALSPGPGAYEPAQALGRQALSTKPDATCSAFPKAARPSLVPVGSTAIGPGQYGAFNAACENQVDSRKPTCASIRFGTGYKRGSNSERFDLSEPAPGPGSYVLPGGIASAARGTPYRNSPAAHISGRNKFGSPW